MALVMFTFRDLDMKQYSHCMAILQIRFIDGAKNQYMIILITLSTLDSQRKLLIFITYINHIALQL